MKELWELFVEEFDLPPDPIPDQERLQAVEDNMDSPGPNQPILLIFEGFLSKQGSRHVQGDGLNPYLRQGGDSAAPRTKH